jgi:type IV secretory pathway VirJ component
MRPYTLILALLIISIQPLFVNVKESFGYVRTNKKITTLLPIQEKAFIPPKDMSLKVIPPVEKNNLPFVFMISGDGGWTKFDQRLAESLAQKGYATIGLDALKYFWTVKTPEQTTVDIIDAIKHYQNLWNKQAFVLIGYSFGADVIPFIANRLDTNLKESLHGILALSPDKYSDFEINISDLLHIGKSTKYDVLAELKKIKQIEPITFFGSKEDINIRNHFKEAGIKTIILAGGHHFNNDYETISMNLHKHISNNIK